MSCQSLVSFTKRFSKNLSDWYFLSCFKKDTFMSHRWNRCTKIIGKLYQIVIAFVNRNASAGNHENVVNHSASFWNVLKYILWSISSRYFIPNFAANLDRQNLNRYILKVFILFLWEKLFIQSTSLQQYISKLTLKLHCMLIHISKFQFLTVHLILNSLGCSILYVSVFMSDNLFLFVKMDLYV